MRAMLPTAGEAATKAVVRSDSEKSLTVQTESDENAWFSKPARGLLGSDPGLALHILSGKTISESSGYRYASGDRSIPIIPFRQLVFRPDGAPWLGVFMEGCTAPWWLDFKHAAEVGRRVLEITKRG